MTNSNKTISFILFGFILISLGQSSVQIDSSPKSLLSANDLNELLQTSNDFDTKFRLLEASLIANSENDYKNEHIPKALYFDAMRGATPTAYSPINFPEEEPFRAYVSSLGISNDHHIILYDRSNSGINDTARVWWVYSIYGHNKLSILNGGLKSWKEAGFAVTDKIEKFPETNFILSFNNNKIRNFTDVYQNTKTKKEVLVDSRDKVDFLKKAIPNSLNMPFLDLIDKKTLRLKNLEEIRSLFDSAGIQLSDPMIMSCFKGLKAASLGYLATLIGASNVALYPGSWSDYSQRINSIQLETQEL